GRDAPRLWIVTRGSQAIAHETISVAQAPLWGLARTILHEHPQLDVRRIDLAYGDDGDQLERLLHEFAAKDPEEEVALRGSRRFVGRLVRRAPAESAPERVVAAADRPFQLRIDRPGVLDRLALRPLQRRSPGKGEVEIAVRWASLNFIDVLKAM